LTYAPSIVPTPSNKKARLYLAGRVFINKRVLARSPPGAPIIQAIEIIRTRHHATNLQSGIQPRQPRRRSGAVTRHRRHRHQTSVRSQRHQGIHPRRAARRNEARHQSDRREHNRDRAKDHRIARLHLEQDDAQ